MPRLHGAAGSLIGQVRRVALASTVARRSAFADAAAAYVAAMTSIRPVTRVVTAHRQQEGAGFTVRRPFPGADLALADPFLLLDELGPVGAIRRDPAGRPS